MKRSIAKQPGVYLPAAALALSIYAFGCVSEETSSEGARRTARRHLAAGDYVQAEASYRKAAAWSSDSKDRTKALLGVGIARLQRGETAGALDAFREAQRINRNPKLAPRISRHLGTAYLAQQHWVTAQRYFRQSLSSTEGEQRDVVLARLALCSHKLGQEERAREYRSRVADPDAHHVAAILAGDDPLLRSADASRSDRRTPPRRTHRSSRSDEERTVATAPARPRTRPPPARRPSPISGGGGERIQVELREQWNAAPRRGNIRRMQNVHRITVHHTAGEPNWHINERDVAESIRKIQRYHQKENGWADIGYHYVIDRAGRIWQGRKMKWQGAHAGGSANQGNVGIVVLGNYSRQRLNGTQKKSLRALVSRLSLAFDIAADRVYTHREIHGKTECPGTHLQRFVDSLRSVTERSGRRSLALGD